MGRVVSVRVMSMCNGGSVYIGCIYLCCVYLWVAFNGYNVSVFGECC
jgi:hypothetical protein